MRNISCAASGSPHSLQSRALVRHGGEKCIAPFGPWLDVNSLLQTLRPTRELSYLLWHGLCVLQVRPL